jgi:hypothetical protein
MAGTLSQGFAGAGRWLRREFSAIWPVFLFFLVGFFLLILLIKVALAQFSVEVAELSNAVIGALLAAKAALILDETPLARSLEHYRRVAAVSTKVLFYGVTCLLLLYIERVLEALHKFHNLDAAFRSVFEHASRAILVWALGISIVFALYFAFVEIDERMGEGGLWRLFFESRTTATDSRPPSNIRASQR